MGYHRAGFEVVGVDIKHQPRYPFPDGFVQADALQFLSDLIGNGQIQDFDCIHASPPCQAHTAMKTMWNAKEHRDFIGETRELLRASGLPYVIENVEGAPLEYPTLLCGTMFNLGCEGAELRRHRIFETSFFCFAPECRHGQSSVIGIYGGHARNRTRTIGIYGEGARDSRRKLDKGVPDFNVNDAKKALDIDWMTLAEMCQAIPPAYTSYIGAQLLAVVSRSAAVRRRPLRGLGRK